MSEYQENIGRRVELRQQRLRLVAECEALRERLRRLLPLDADVHCLDHEAVLSAAIAFDQSALELTAVDRKLTVLDSILGK